MTQLRVRRSDVPALLNVVFFAAIGIGLIVTVGFMYERWVWFAAALGVFNLGSSLRRLSFSRHMTDTRQQPGLSMLRSYKLALAAYVVAGGLVIVGALLSLERVFGFIVAFGAFCWVWGWSWALARLTRRAPDAEEL